ncbi:MAG: tRNA pseudouridine(55) synthase TruB, partial [Bdellovibrionales bacterium]|nr:tRNA pseudouridine(55) synthase TruB [Bdellovibrionales bacterium]
MLHDFNGAFLINKEKGFTSHDIVFKLRKILKLKQIGHTGTLDPMATGLLICLVGPSVRLLPYLGAENKKYSLELELGKTTDSWDITGQVLSVAKIEKLKEESLMSEINAMQGGLMIPIPMYSAKKVDGLKLYEIARKNQSELTQPVDQ